MLSMQQIAGALTSRLAKRLFVARQAEFWLGELDPLLSLDEVRARVVHIVDETPDVKTFVLEPNAAWHDHDAGQYTTVEVEIDGACARRCYSISSAPGSPHIAITVKRVPGGRVSGWLHDRVQVGDVLRLGDAAGDFVLPPEVPSQLLLLSGGSGITPVMSILRDLAARNAIADVAFVHHARTADDVAFAHELRTLAEQYAGLQLFICLDDDETTPHGFDEAHLTALVPDFADRATYLCGPPALMDRVERMWTDAGASDRLSRERFVVSRPPVEAASTGEGMHVRLSRSERDVIARGSGSLLEQLERAGERPAHGCRMGICHTCKCTKKSGTVQNLVTGETSSEPNEQIRLCVSVPRSKLELDL